MLLVWWTVAIAIYAVVFVDQCSSNALADESINVNAESFDEDDLIADKSLEFPETVPVFDRPRLTEPFVGFDYFASKADLVVVKPASIEEMVSALSDVVVAKLQAYLRTHFPDFPAANEETAEQFKELAYRRINSNYEGPHDAEAAVLVDGSLARPSWADEARLAQIMQTKLHVHIFFVHEFFYSFVSFFAQYKLTRFSFITFSNYDFCVPYIYEPRLVADEAAWQLVDSLLANRFLNKWFAKNACIQHEKLVPIPLGPKWQFHSPETFAEDISVIKNIYTRYCSSPFAYFKNFSVPGNQELIDQLPFKNRPKKDKLLYYFFDIHTTDDPYWVEHLDFRAHLAAWLDEQGFPKAPKLSPKGYLNELSRYKFAISPPGKGIDTHRTWEALMVGTIPIVLSSPLNPLFDGLPVLILEDYSVLSKDFLHDMYEQFHAEDNVVSFAKAYSQYWNEVFASNSIPDE